MPKKILLADDSITIQKVVELTFSEGDYQVFSVGNGSLALKKIQEIRPDIALLDVIMPEANGYEVCEKVKRNPEISWIPVLLLTGTFEPFDRRRADAAGANGHLTKPFESQMLISKVEELIAAHRHPLAEPQRAGRMEIIAGGETYRLETDEESSSGASADSMTFAEAEPELSRQSIVPDRFDDFEPFDGTGEGTGLPPAAEGAQTIRISSESILPPAGLRLGGNGEENATPLEPWDELASGLAGPTPGLREPSSSEDRSPVLGAQKPSRETGAFAPQTADVPALSEGMSPPEPEPAGLPRPSLESDRGYPSQGEVERIVSRLVEQISEKVIREVAWEVIPELAETLIKQRIRELEEKISREG